MIFYLTKNEVDFLSDQVKILTVKHNIGLMENSDLSKIVKSKNFSILHKYVKEDKLARNDSKSIFCQNILFSLIEFARQLVSPFSISLSELRNKAREGNYKYILRSSRDIFKMVFDESKKEFVDNLKDKTTLNARQLQTTFNIGFILISATLTILATVGSFSILKKLWSIAKLIIRGVISAINSFRSKLNNWKGRKSEEYKNTQLKALSVAKDKLKVASDLVNKLSTSKNKNKINRVTDITK